MVKPTTSPILQLIRRVVEDPQVREIPDRDLLQRFHAQQDQAAFHTLLRRYGPMVLDVSRSVLGDGPDAEDAFQATFLVLAHKAGSIRKGASLGSWLHGVAHRTALKARAQSATRQKHEARAPVREVSQADDLSWREVRHVLHEELGSIPARYREPLVTCYLEGATRQCAAARLGLSETTLQERLERGRELLRVRLVRRGLGPAAVLAIAAWPAASVSAAVPAVLVDSSVMAATSVAAGAAAASVASAKVAALAERVLKAMLLTKLKIATAVLMVLTLIGAGSVVLTRSLSAADEPQAKEADQPAVPESIVGAGEGVQKVAWSPNGKFLAVLTNIYDVAEQDVFGEKKKILFDHCTLMLWDVEKKAWMPTTVPLEPKVRVWALAVSPDSKTLAFGLQDLSASDRFDIRLVDVEKGKEKKSFPFGEEQGAEIRGIVFTSNDTLAVWGRDVEERSVLKVFDVEMEKPKGVVHAKAPRDSEFTCFAFSSDGKSSALGIDGTIRVAKPGKKETVPLEGHSKPIFSLAFSPDARFLVSGSWDNTVKVWDLSNDQLLHTLTADDQSLNAVALSPDGKTVAIGIVIRKDEKITGQELRLFDVQTGNLKRALKVRAGTVAFSPDGRTLATGGLGVEPGYKTVGELRLWPLGKK